MTRLLLADGAIDLRLGDAYDVLADVDAVDSVITDVPYGPRVIANQMSAAPRGADGWQEPVRDRIAYDPWLERDAVRFMQRWAPITRRWLVVFCSDDVANWLRAALLDADSREWVSWLLPWVKPDGAPSFTGTGPSPQAEWIVVARPKGGIVRRFRPGFYDSRQQRGSLLVGQKPLELMRAIVRDYSEPGDLVVDPCCGTGTTALACVPEERRCITSERDPNTFALAHRRIVDGAIAARDPRVLSLFATEAK